MKQDVDAIAIACLSTAATRRCTMTGPAVPVVIVHSNVHTDFACLVKHSSIMGSLQNYTLLMWVDETFFMVSKIMYLIVIPLITVTVYLFYPVYLWSLSSTTCLLVFCNELQERQ